MTVYLGKNPVGIGRIVEKKVAKKKFGATVDTFLGDVNENGVLQPSTEQVDLVFDGVKEIGCDLRYKFYKNESLNYVHFNDLITISNERVFSNTFNSCTNLIEADFNNLSSIGGFYGCDYMFSKSGLQSINLEKLTTITGNYSCYYMFSECKFLKNIDLNNLINITGSNACSHMFYDCSALETVILNKLKTVNGGSVCDYLFANCTNLQFVDLSSLESIISNGACNSMFRGCKKLLSINLNNLTTIDGGTVCAYMFNSTGITILSFPKLTTFINTYALNNMFSGATKLTEVHFRADMQATIEALTGYSSKFGAPSTCTIYFDL